MVLAACFCGLAAWRAGQGAFARAPLWAGLGGGLLAGLGVAPLAAGLMVFKNGLHAHGFPDFPAGEIAAVLGKTPLWGVSGLFVGVGMALWSRFRQFEGE